ncbi:hypothetical protein DFA_01958 [Cavenderia fasciculata]|uniref:Carbohydrate binding domain-containing protein n=1 Tax=Cavenderia fasciculata TaxID=261658 RepID=F4PR11_CACFS|nr:uncharacterized protein DFA_01958 [Cavenderia fasciculata]EGG22068.1 hypothetical protein DFA_01958 [Cavenderia fasciculata]|eukprot:XP_004359919.1 hypothetical protein DFA_01958 [Cavenderia fasciculata]
MIKILLLLLISISIIFVNGQDTTCSTKLQPFISAGVNYQCNQVAITGIQSSTGSILSVKANVFFYRYYDGLRQNTASQLLSSESVSCDAPTNTNQPFSSATGLSELIIYRNATIQFGSNPLVSLQCSSSSSNLFTFQLADSTSFQLFIKTLPIELGCPSLKWKDTCTTSTTGTTTGSPVTTTTTTTSTTTGSPVTTTTSTTTGPPFTQPPRNIPLISFKNVTNQWVSEGKTYYQFTHTIVNPNVYDVKDVKLTIQGQFNPTQYWNIVIQDNTIILPDYANPLKAGKWVDFGYIVTDKDSFTFTPTFTK